MRLAPVVLTWFCLLVLVGVEFGASRVPAGAAVAPFIGVAMAMIVAMTFMRLASAPGLAAVFALAGVFWLAVLFGLGSLDSATRHDVPIPMRTSS